MVASGSCIVQGIPQRFVFYSSSWTEAVDRRFIEVLLDEKRKGFFCAGGMTTHSTLMALYTVNHEFNATFDLQYCTNRVEKLRKRFSVFNWMINLDSVVYDRVNHRIECTINTWEFVYTREFLGLAYKQRAETQFAQLKDLFGDNVWFWVTDSYGNVKPVIKKGPAGCLDADAEDPFMHELFWYTCEYVGMFEIAPQVVAE